MATILPKVSLIYFDKIVATSLFDDQGFAEKSPGRLAPKVEDGYYFAKVYLNVAPSSLGLFFADCLEFRGLCAKASKSSSLQ